LFCDRAMLAGADALNDTMSRVAAAAICRRLDGVPLAIELAAARAGALSLGDLAQTLDHALDLLQSSSPSLPERHRSLRAMIGWSHALLDEDEQTVLRRLGAFRGGFTLAAAEAVCDHELAQVVVAGLVERSLIQLTAGRYHLLETIRAFAYEELAKAGETAATARRHAEYYRTMVQQAQRGLLRCDADTLRAIDAELNNLRAADAWAQEHAPLLQGEIAAGLGEFWWATRRPEEGLAWTQAALRRSEAHLDQTVRAGLLLTLRLRISATCSWTPGQIAGSCTLSGGR
jgi:predicted ATPase